MRLQQKESTTSETIGGKSKIPKNGLDAHLSALRPLKQLPSDDIATPPKLQSPRPAPTLNKELLQELLVRCLKGEISFETTFKVLKEKNDLETCARAFSQILNTEQWGLFFRGALKLEHAEGKVFMRLTATPFGQIGLHTVDEIVYKPMRNRALQHSVFYEMLVLITRYTLELEQKEYEIFKLSRSNRNECEQALEKVFLEKYEGSLQEAFRDIGDNGIKEEIEGVFEKALGDERIRDLFEWLQDECDVSCEKKEAKQQLLASLSGTEISLSLRSAAEDLNLAKGAFDNAKKLVDANIEKLEKDTSLLIDSFEAAFHIALKKIVSTDLDIKETSENKSQLVEKLKKLSLHFKTFSQQKQNVIRQLTATLKKLPVEQEKNNSHEFINQFSAGCLVEDIKKISHMAGAEEVKSKLGECVNKASPKSFIAQAVALGLDIDKLHSEKYFQKMLLLLQEKTIKQAVQSLIIDRQFGEQLIQHLVDICRIIQTHRDEVIWLRVLSVEALDFLKSIEKITDPDKLAAKMSAPLLTRMFCSFITKAGAIYQDAQLGKLPRGSLTRELSSLLQKLATTINFGKLEATSMSRNVIRYISDPTKRKELYNILLEHGDSKTFTETREREATKEEIEATLDLKKYDKITSDIIVKSDLAPKPPTHTKPGRSSRSTSKVERISDPSKGMDDAKKLLIEIAILSSCSREQKHLPYSAHDLQTLIEKTGFTQCIEVLSYEIPDDEAWLALYTSQLNNVDGRPFAHALFQKKMHAKYYKALCERKIDEPILYEFLITAAEFEVEFQMYELHFFQEKNSATSSAGATYNKALLNLASNFIKRLGQVKLPDFWLKIYQVQLEHYKKLTPNNEQQIQFKLIEWLYSSFILPTFQVISDARYDIAYPIGQALKRQINNKFLKSLNEQLFLDGKPLTAEPLVGCSDSLKKKGKRTLNAEGKKLFDLLTPTTGNTSRNTALKGLSLASFSAASKELQEIQFSAIWKAFTDIINYLPLAYASVTRKKIADQFVVTSSRLNESSVTFLRDKSHLLLEHLKTVKMPELDNEEEKLKSKLDKYYHELVPSKRLQSSAQSQFLKLPLNEKYKTLLDMLKHSNTMNKPNKSLKKKLDDEEPHMKLLAAKQFHIPHNIKELDKICELVDNLAKSVGCYKEDVITPKDKKRLSRRSSSLSEPVDPAQSETKKNGKAHKVRSLSLKAVKKKVGAAISIVSPEKKEQQQTLIDEHMRLTNTAPSRRKSNTPVAFQYAGEIPRKGNTNNSTQKRSHNESWETIDLNGDTEEGPSQRSNAT